ncbi:DNA helicase-2/ATP-dependent DNA helicase PcrA [Roseiarcus fermentans]|uniref:DNA 3'-5' helicase n=1 Tax=Roseiarcus fermentans TaxID=1473586 RepID=A0A366FT30_9HYPH|nr:ATP-dependent helicase [Roseiarcus fermentans]RBP17200.1 DNA helicase-2/ATP-dependent DNA helicase PcrA [Roseiarcus fermentans]
MSLALIRAAQPVELNPEQRLAVEHGLGAAEGFSPLLVIAGAGSGKTAMLAHRVAALILGGADPKRIMLATFSRRAAAELVRRVERLLARRLPAEAAAAAAPDYSGTFHAIGARLLREYAPRVGLDPQFTIHDREDSADLMNWARHEAGLTETKERFPTKATCLAVYSRVVNAQADLGKTIGRWFPWVAAHEEALRALFAAYVEAKQRQNVLDYDDLLLWFAQMLAEPDIAAEIAGRFDHLLVDEYQDTNALQAEIVLALRPRGRGLTVVGDDAQSIYSFRAATVRNILDFPGAFEPPARVVTLDRNYRSTEPILAAANAVIALAPERFAKDLWSDRREGAAPALVVVPDEADQARFVATAVLQNREAGAALKSQAVLFRASHHSAPLELELTRRNIPFVKFGGLKFLDAAHVKDALALMRFAENPRDRVAGFRVAQLLPGVGPKIAGAIVAAAAEDDGFAAMSALELPARARAGFDAFARLLRRLAARAAPWPGELADAVAWLAPVLETRYDDCAARIGDLEALERIAGSFASRDRFLSELTLDPPDATSDEAGPPLRDEDYLILSTIHSAKGQEWRSVFVLNCVDGCIPSDLATGSSEEIEEERRLLYVAMTRARDDLTLIVPQRFYVHGQPKMGDRSVFAGRTRFIPPPLLKHFLRRTWPEAAPSPPRLAADGPRVDLAARMRSMWR